LLYKFIWNKRWDSKAKDRIKRELIKGPYDKGGLKGPDVYSLDESLKYKQLLRQMESGHSIGDIVRHTLINKIDYILPKVGFKYTDKAIDTNNKLYSRMINEFIRYHNDPNNKLSIRYKEVIASTDMVNIAKYFKLNQNLIDQVKVM
jgi:hypothetical protein